MVFMGVVSHGDAARPIQDDTDDNANRMHDLGAMRREPFSMFRAAQRRLRLDCGVLHAEMQSSEGEKIAVELAELRSAPLSLRARALGLLGVCAHGRGDNVKARRLLEESVSICERGGDLGAIDSESMGVPYLTIFLFEGIGGPVDKNRAREVLAHGVRLRIGSSLTLAASTAQSLGDVFAAAALWELAADARSEELSTGHKLSPPTFCAPTYRPTIFSA